MLIQHLICGVITLKINKDMLREVYDYIVENHSIEYLNEYLDIEEDKIATFEEFKEYLKSSIIANLQYDFDVRINLNELIEMED